MGTGEGAGLTGAERAEGRERVDPHARADWRGAPAWADAHGRWSPRPEPARPTEAARAVGELQGASYERNAFARGTEAEADELCARLALEPDHRLLDLGAATGRHSRALAARGCGRPVAVDLSHTALCAGAAREHDAATAAADRAAAVPPVQWVQADARALPLPAASVDAAVSLCQGGFGLTPDHDRAVLAELARVLRPGGRLALTAYSLAFAARFLAPEDALDLPRGLLHAPTEIRDAHGRDHPADHWSTCYSPAHLRDLLDAVGLETTGLWGWEPGAPTGRPPVVTDPELLVVAVRQASIREASI